MREFSEADTCSQCFGCTCSSQFKCHSEACHYTVFIYLQFFSGHYDYEVVHVKIAVCRPIVLKSKRIHVAVFDFDGEVGVFLFFTLIAFVIDSAASLDGVSGFIITGVDAFVLLKRVILARPLYFSFYDQIVA